MSVILNIIGTVNALRDHCHNAAAKSGWWTHRKTGLDLVSVIRSPVNPAQELLAGALVAQKLALVHSEVSEALEGHRKDKMDEHLPHLPSIGVELADAFIRICDTAGALNIDLGRCVAEKMLYNADRADHKPENREAVGGKSY